MEKEIIVEDKKKLVQVNTQSRTRRRWWSVVKEKQYWRRLEKQRSIYRKRRNMNEYIDRQTAERINSYEIGFCPFWRTYQAVLCLGKEPNRPLLSFFITNADRESVKEMLKVIIYLVILYFCVIFVVWGRDKHH